MDTGIIYGMSLVMPSVGYDDATYRPSDYRGNVVLIACKSC